MPRTKPSAVAIKIEVPRFNRQIFKGSFVERGKNGRYFVTNNYSNAFYPCTEERLGDVIKNQRIRITLVSKKTPRLAIITRKGKSITVDRQWLLTEALQEAAEIIFVLQNQDRAGKYQYYKQIGL